MKTGGTLNFLRKAGVIFMLLAIFATSCNKYADDFDQVNKKLDALATTVAGVAQLTSDMSALKGQVTALQGAVATLPTKTQTDASFLTLTNSLGVISGKIDAITTTLGTVASTGLTTKGVVDQLKIDLATLTTKVTNDNATLTTKLDGLATTDLEQSQTLADLVTANNSILSQIADVKTALDAVALTGSGTDATAVTIKGLQLMLDAQKADLAQILANTSMYTGAVSILTDTDVDFYMLKIAQMNIINGSLTVNPALVTKMTDLNTILTKVTAIVGSNPVVLTASATAAKALNLSNLVSVSGSVQIIGGNKISQTSVDISKLSSVSGNFTYSLDGAISLPLLSAIGGNLDITEYTTTGTTVLGTTSLDLSAAAVTGTIKIGTTLNQILLPSATSVIAPVKGVTLVSGVKITSFKSTTAAAAAGLTVTPKNTATVDLSSLTSAAGALTVSASTTVILSNLATSVGAVSVTTVAAGTVNLDKFDSDVAVTIVGAKSVSLPLWTGGAASSLVAAAAETISLPAHTWVWGTVPTAPNWYAVEVLTVGDVSAPVALGTYTTLTDVTLTGATVDTWADFAATATSTAANAALVNITLHGMWKAVSITDNAAAVIKSVVTDGAVINSFTLADADLLTDLTLGHTSFTSVVDGTPGGMLLVNTCDLLETLTSSTIDKVVTLSIDSNPKLATIALTGLANKANVGVGTAFSFIVKGNMLAGDFTPAVAAVAGVSPYVEAKITSAELLKLKAYVTSAMGTGYAAKTCNLVYDVDALDAPVNLVTLMGANDATSVAIDQTSALNGIDVLTELGIIQ